MRQAPQVADPGLSLTPPQLTGSAALLGWRQLDSSTAVDAVLPGQTCSFQLNLPRAVLACGATFGSQTLLEVRAVVAWDLHWCPAGHEVLCQQYNISHASPATERAQAQQPVSPGQAKDQSAPVVKQAADSVTVSGSSGSDDGSSWSMQFSLKTGMLTSWTIGQADVMEESVEPCFVRAATDNDVGGSGGTSHAARWLKMGLDKLSIEECSVDVQDRSGSSITIQSTFTMKANGESILDKALQTTGAGLELGGAHWFAQEGPGHTEAAQETSHVDGKIKLQVLYTISRLGELGMVWTVDTRTFMPLYSAGHMNSLPRIGLRFSLPQSLKQCLWHGKGPQENYVDRDTGAPVRLYEAEVDLLQTPYIAPSENAGRGGVQWVGLLPAASDANLCPGFVVAHAPVEASSPAQTWPLRASDKSQAASYTFVNDTNAACVPGEGLHFSASYHNVMNLLRAKHQHELEEGPCQLHIDGMHMGVGGDDSWTPSVHCKYLLPPGRYQYGMKVKAALGWTNREDVIRSAQMMT
eukprot:jgi/Ulvmu1/4393/UM002_0118.1